jgi:hypothetical protein
MLIDIVELMGLYRFLGTRKWGKGDLNNLKKG